MTAAEVLDELQALGNPSIKKVLAKHGAREPFHGVKVEDLQKVRKRIKVDHSLALELYDSGISDAMYLAGLIADDPCMTRANLERWVNGAYWSMLAEYTVPWVASGNPLGLQLAREWVESPEETIASAGWSTLSCLVSLKPDAELPLDELEGRLNLIADSIHQQPNRVRYVMNGFVMSVGCCVLPLGEAAWQTARAIGPVAVNMGETSCKVPLAAEMIENVRTRGTLGKKKKSVKC